MSAASVARVAAAEPVPPPFPDADSRAWLAALENRLQLSGSSGTSRPCHARRRSFTAVSSSANLYAQVVKRLSPR